MDNEYKPESTEQSSDQIENVKKYIQQQLSTGLQPDEIATQFRQAGWTEDHIKQAFQLVQAQVMPTTSVALPAATAASTSQPDAKQPVQQPIQIAAQTRGRTKTGWLLLKQSLRVLQNNKVLTRYMLMSLVVSFGLLVVIVIIFILGRNIFFTKDAFDSHSQNGGFTPAGYAVAFVYYVLAFFMINLYAAGLAANVLDLFHGNSKPYREYMRIAVSRGKTIFVYSVIEATVGLILRAIAERSKLLGQIVARILGALWSIARLFVIPIIVSSDENAFGAIKQSTLLLKATWGENIVGRASFGLGLFLIYFLVVIPVSIAVLVLGTLAGGEIGAIISLVLVLLFVLVVGIINSAADSVLNIALFYYAQNKQIPAAFDADLINSVFIQRKQRKGLFGRKA